jgi:glucokinase
MKNIMGNKKPKKVGIGIDIGGTKILGALVNENGIILDKIYIPSDGVEGAKEVLKNLREIIMNLLERAVNKSISVIGIGIGTGGLISPYDGKIMFATDLIPNWKGIDLKREMESSFKLKTLVEVDGNAAALGEKRYGAGVFVDDMVCITVGTGIGGGIIKDARLFKGKAGCAGMIGHISIDANGPLCSCGNRGCVEKYASGTAIAEMANYMIGREKTSMISMLSKDRGEKISGKLVGEAAKKGDKLAQFIIKKAGKYIGLALVSVVNLFNPQIIVIGGGVSDLGDILIDPIREIIKLKALPPAVDTLKVVQSSLGNTAVLIGAASMLWDDIKIKNND